LVNVRFSPNSGHRTAVTECPLRARRRRSAIDRAAIQAARQAP
jgi:hypothetical protein